MEIRRISARYTPEISGEALQALTAGGAWLRLGSAGALTLAAGLVFAFRGEAELSSALALILGGGLVAAVCLRRAWTILERADAWDVSSADARPSTRSCEGQSSRPLGACRT